MANCNRRRKQKSRPHCWDSLLISSSKCKRTSQARYDISIGMDMVIVTVVEVSLICMGAILGCQKRFVNPAPYNKFAF
jgi:hypothetical protein